jgi:predicted nucleic acid-binding protein
VLAIATAPTNQLSILALSTVEVHSAVRRRQRDGDIPEKIADQLLGLFRQHLNSKFVQQRVTDKSMEEACVLVDKYGLTTMDAIHLAVFESLSAQSPRTTWFATADRQLVVAARGEGATILDVSA